MTSCILWKITFTTGTQLVKPADPIIILETKTMPICQTNGTVTMAQRTKEVHSVFIKLFLIEKYVKKDSITRA
jgi:hypothetical protein